MRLCFTLAWWIALPSVSSSIIFYLFLLFLLNENLRRNTREQNIKDSSLFFLFLSYYSSVSASSPPLWKFNTQRKRTGYIQDSSPFVSSIIFYLFLLLLYENLTHNTRELGMKRIVLSSFFSFSFFLFVLPFSSRLIFPLFTSRSFPLSSLLYIFLPSPLLIFFLFSLFILISSL